MSYLSSLNNLLTTTTSRYASLRRNILSSSSEDDTGITDPESSHVSRVLRAYYTEKNRPFPAWLGVDPREVARAQQPAQPQPYVTNRPLGSLRGTSSTSTIDAGGRNGSAGGLGDLWSDGPAAVPPVEDPNRGSLRRGVLGGGRRGQQQQQQQQQLGQGQQGGGGLEPRPLPSQRAGSYQTQQQQQGIGIGIGERPPGSSGSAGSGGGSAQERLKARLNRGGGSGRSTPDNGGGGYGGGEGRYGRDDGRGGTGSYATQGLSGWQGRR